MNVRVGASTPPPAVASSAAGNEEQRVSALLDAALRAHPHPLFLDTAGEVPAMFARTWGEQ